MSSFTKSAATIAHLARHQYQAAASSSTSRQHQHYQFSTISRLIPANNCGYVVLNRRLRLRRGVKDSLKNSLVGSPENLDLGRHNRSSLVQRCQRGFIVKDKERECSECKNIVVISLLAHAQECETTRGTMVSNDN